MIHKNKILIFDWDGVIVDSNMFKWKTAWETVFADDQKKRDTAIQILQTSEGRRLSRFELVKQVLSISGNTAVDTLSKEDVASHPDILFYTDKFSHVLIEGIPRCGLFPHAREILVALKEKGYLMYVISATYESDLLDVVNQLGLSSLFIEVYGSPTSKFDNFKKIYDKEGDAGYVVIGDGEGDYELSHMIGCPFVGISNAWNRWNDDSVMKNISVESITHVPDFLSDTVLRTG